MNESQRAHYLKAMGIQQWVHKTNPMVASSPASVAPSTSESTAVAEALESKTSDWDSLRQAVSVCTKCDLHNSRTQTVFGVGSVNADWMVIGEAPGADEDRQGEPFVGRAGQLLNEMLRAIGLSREQVYIANILKCRPPNNRDPQVSEVDHCKAYLNQQIDWVKPKVILAVGRISAQNLLESEAAIGRLRGRVHQLPGRAIPVVATYHPAYLLRKPSEKGKSWDDLKLAKKTVAS